MALPKDPTVPEFFVYTLEVAGVPFYVGIGRSARASDRVRYVRYMLQRESQGKPVKWGLSTRVIAGILQRGYDIEVAYQRRGMTRGEAIIEERVEIVRLIKAGSVLANVQHNVKRPRQAGDVLVPLLALLPLPPRADGTSR
jgi:hypothetical protein